MAIFINQLGDSPMAENIVALKTLCTELKVEPREARARLRWAVKHPKQFPELSKAYKPRQPWQWEGGSAAHKEASRAIGQPVPKS